MGVGGGMCGGTIAQVGSWGKVGLYAGSVCRAGGLVASAIEDMAMNWA